MNTRKLMADGLLEYIGQAGDDDQYADVEWLASKGAAKIDTGISGANNNLKIEMRFKYEGYTAYKSFYGTYTNENTDCTRLILSNADDGRMYAYLNSKAGGGLTSLTLNPKTGWHDFWMTKQQTSLDGVVTTTTGASGTAASTTQTIKLFTHSSTATDTTCTVYISAFKIWDGDYPLRDFVPKIRVRDGKPGMYDRIGHKFYTNIGTDTDFMWGPSAASYIQDGLILMLDGIENAGWGLHDAEASVWKNLADDTDGTLTDSGAWTSLGRTGVSGISDAIVRIPGRWDYYHVETCGYLGSKNNPADNQYMKLGRYGCAYKGNATAAAFISNGTTRWRVLDAIQSDTPFSFGLCTRPYSAFVNGVECSMVVDDSESYSGENDTQRFFVNCLGVLYAVRKYNRQLTAEEVAHNYRVDKMRFGLP